MIKDNISKIEDLSEIQNKKQSDIKGDDRECTSPIPTNLNLAQGIWHLMQKNTIYKYTKKEFNIFLGTQEIYDMGLNKKYLF